ncbi:MAG: pyridoxal phosphate-dependent aminotransferase [Trueperaceae bacterium]|nr:MAG: pyridoxal phosphate-dependent aminotransferase [Trueperaceae bacterium]
MTTPPLLQARAERIVEEDVSFRTKMLEIAAGQQDVIAMGRGDPDFHTPSHIVEAAKRAIDANEHHYTHPAGLPDLRAAIADTLAKGYDLSYNVDEIIVTAGVQESIMLCMLALIDPGDEALITSPRFTTYDTAVHLCGGRAVPVPTYERDDFALMPSEIEARITERSKVLVLVSPNNPTGAVTPPNVIREIAALALQHDLIVISDEIYAELIYPGSEHLSIGSLPGMKDRTIVLNGFSKSHAMTGWRIGYLAAPEPFVRLVTEPRHTLSINTCTISQHAALAALTGPQEPVEQMLVAYAERRRVMMEAMDAMGLTYGHPGGAFYLYTNISASGMPAPDFCEALLREAQVMVFPGELFGDDSGHYIRFSYLQPLERIHEALARMSVFVEKLRI